MQDASKFEELLDQLMDAFPSLQEDVEGLKEKIMSAEENGESSAESDMELSEGEEEGEQVLLGAPPMMPKSKKGTKPIPPELMDDEEEEGVDVPKNIGGGW